MWRYAAFIKGSLDTGMPQDDRVGHALWIWYDPDTMTGAVS